MITSNRTFGVEIEVFTDTDKNYKSILGRLNVTTDGSLRPIQYAGEYVSPVLSGKSGVNEIISACDILKKYNAQATHPKTSVHVHIGIGTPVRELVKHKTEPVGEHYLAISKKASAFVDEASITKALATGNMPRFNMVDVIKESVWDNKYYYYSLLIPKIKPKIGYYYYTLKPDPRFEVVKNTFYFYTKFSDAFENLVSKSRRFGNFYCIPIGDGFELSEIKSCNTMKELKVLWYKNTPGENKHNDSRYYSYNLHSFFSGATPTYEIRSHGGTIDPIKILLWVSLHQTVADWCVGKTIADIDALGDDQFKGLLSILNSDLLEQYVKRLWGFYSGITVK